MSFSSILFLRYHVFPSFSGQDVRKSFLSHLLKELHRKSIDTFIDISIERSLPIDPALLLAIKESKISIVIFSKNYASSTWCLNELVAIHKCFRELKQMVIPIFYDVVPSDVRKQTGEFGKLFEETCKGKPEDHKQRWMQALSDVAKIPGYVLLNGANEANMIKKIARDVSEKLINWCSTGLAFLIVINLLLEIASAVVEHLSSIRKPYLARISVVMSFLSIVLSILDFFYKIRAHKARFRCKWPIPWFYYYPAHGYNRIFGNFTDTVLLCCAVGGFIVSTVNWSFIEKRREGPIKASVWPLFFAIGLFGMVVYKFFQEKLAISKDNYTLDDILIDRFED